MTGNEHTMRFLDYLDSLPTYASSDGSHELWEQVNGEWRRCEPVVQPSLLAWAWNWFWRGKW
jgi:hypothetical protein